jgi:putative lipoprotein
MRKQIPVIGLTGIMLLTILLVACGGGDSNGAPPADTAVDQPADQPADNAGAANPDGNSPPPLIDTKWELISINGNDPLEGTTVTLNVTSARVFRGNGGCNDYGAEYQADGGSISVSNLQYTEVGCTDPAGVMEQEQQYFTMVNAASSLTVEGGKLQMTTSSGDTLIFKRK